jgi:hypothetical protein
VFGSRVIEEDLDVAVVVAGDQDVAAVDRGRVGIAFGLRMFGLEKTTITFFQMIFYLVSIFNELFQLCLSLKPLITLNLVKTI